MAPAAVVDAEDDDPVVAEYDVFITPETEDQLYVLQYRAREIHEGFTSELNEIPSEVRIKPESGFVEVDVPVYVHDVFNRAAAVRWGEAVRKTKGHGQQAWGLATGFEHVHVPRLGGRPGAGANARGAAPEGDEQIEEYIRNFDDANNNGHVLNTITHGGQIVYEGTGGANYMLGSFENDQLHLTKLNGIVQMRPQHKHIDAAAQLARLAAKQEKEAQDNAPASQPRSVLPTIKQKGASDSIEATKKFLRDTFEEKWTRLHYHSEESGRAYDAHHERVFLPEAESASKLHASLKNDSYIDAISAPTHEKSGKRKLTKRKSQIVDISDVSDDPGDEAPAVASAAQAMEVDG